MTASFRRDMRAWLAGLDVAYQERPGAHDTDLAGDGPHGRVRVLGLAMQQPTGLGDFGSVLGMVRVSLGDPAGPPDVLAAEWWDYGPLAIYSASPKGLTAVLHHPAGPATSLSSLERRADDGFAEPSFLARVDRLVRLSASDRRKALRSLATEGAERARKGAPLLRRAGGVLGGGLGGGAAVAYLAAPLLVFGPIPFVAATAVGALAGATGGGFAAARLGEASMPAWLRRAVSALRSSGLFDTVHAAGGRTNVWSGSVLLDGRERPRGPALFFGGGRVEARIRREETSLLLDTFSLEVSGEPSRAMADLPRRWAILTLRLPEARRTPVLGGLRATLDEPEVLVATMTEQNAAAGAFERDVLTPLVAHLQAIPGGPYR